MSEVAAKESIREPLPMVLWRWLTSAAGITIVLSIVAAIWAAIDAGPFILVNTVVTGGMWALLSMGLSLVFGVMNIPNFAHGEFFLAGSLTAYFVFTPLRRALAENPNTTLSLLAPLLGILAAIVVGLILGAILEKLVFYQLRKRSREQWVMNSFLLTVGISVVIINLVQLRWGADFRGIPRYWDLPALRLFGVNVSVDRIGAFLLAVIALIVFWYFMRHTQTGRAIRAVAQDEMGALMVGINLNRILLLTMSLSAGLAAMAGASLLFIFPAYPTAGLRPLYVAWYVVILVGLGNVSAAVIGGFIVALLQTLTSFYIGVGWEDVIPTAIIIIILIVKPSGLFGSEVKGIQEQ
ncbi:MAG TPA: branched-chain amino acid ABC transporter permease [Candidatus Sulfomarinibacteraceae bacterium]|nr:branched-chain amino acid ABC transporter permease [Candidatus Sulfomarinibacteraceae bacterium]